MGFKKWKVQVLGGISKSQARSYTEAQLQSWGITEDEIFDDEEECEFEVSVLNELGTANGSWGWWSEDKIIFEGIYDFDWAIKIAQILCDRLNELGMESPTQKQARLDKRKSR